MHEIRPITFQIASRHYSYDQGGGLNSPWLRSSPVVWQNWRWNRYHTLSLLQASESPQSPQTYTQCPEKPSQMNIMTYVRVSQETVVPATLSAYRHVHELLHSSPHAFFSDIERHHSVHVPCRFTAALFPPSLHSSTTSCAAILFLQCMRAGSGTKVNHPHAWAPARIGKLISVKVLYTTHASL